MKVTRPLALVAITASPMLSNVTRSLSRCSRSLASLSSVLLLDRCRLSANKLIRTPASMKINSWVGAVGSETVNENWGGKKTYQAISALSMAEITPGHRPPNQAHRTTVGKDRMKGAFKSRRGSSARRNSDENATVRTVKAYRKSVDG